MTTVTVGPRVPPLVGQALPRTKLPSLPHGTGEAHMEQVVAQAMERRGGRVMNLEERIARLIDPEAWWLLDQHREEHPDPDERPGAARRAGWGWAAGGRAEGRRSTRPLPRHRRR